ncbi:MAG: hypothetical protein QOI40_5060 [Alphaproteobacteria bacterium]|nr:hypothetical protein [Alphaproteobacteria bacterium]
MKRLFSKLFSVGKRESNDEIEKLIRFFEDESLQNDRAPKAVREKIIGGTSVDEIPGAFGEFGLTLTNPIPVNGAIGEVVYLSSLRHAGKTQILFHRLGSLSGIDIYEIVNIDGSAWSILYLDFYHPRKSSRSPKGYSIASRDQSSYRLYGVNYLVPNFPYGLFKAVGDYSDRLLGPSMVPLELRTIEGTVRFVRPKNHLRLRDDLEVEWVRRPGSYEEVARIIVDLALREVDELFPAYRTEIGRFLMDRQMLNGKRLAVYEHPILKIGFTACIAAAWYCSVLNEFGARDAGMLTDQLRRALKPAVAGPDRVVFDETFNSALRAAAHALKTGAEAVGIVSPAIGIADALLAVVLLREDQSEPMDVKLTEDFVLQFFHPFHHRSQVAELKLKYVLTKP